MPDILIDILVFAAFINATFEYDEENHYFFDDYRLLPADSVPDPGYNSFF